MTQSKIPTWLPYVLPLALLMLISLVTQSAHVRYPIGYPVTVVVVALTLLTFSKMGCYPELSFSWRFLPIAIVLGLVLCASWVLVDHITPHFAFLGKRVSYDPWSQIADPAQRDIFLLFRFTGLVVVAPLVEELFYRSFLLRYLIDPNDFKSVPVGKYELTSCVATVALMAAAHPEWLAAALFSLAMNTLVYKTKSVGASVMAHGATNLALGIYVIAAHAWVYW